MEDELNAFHAFCQDIHSRQIQAERRLRAAEAAAAALRHQRDSAGEELSETELGTRRTAEEHHSDMVVRRRRQAEHERRLRGVEQRLAAAEESAAAARAAFDEINRTVRDRWSLTLVRVRRLHEHAHRRANLYWRQLVRTHPQGGPLARVGPALPDRLRDDAPIPVVVPEPLKRDNDTGHRRPDETKPKATPILRARRHKLRRIAELDGQPVGTDWPYPDSPVFEPSPVDEQAARDEVKKVVSGLLPHALDEVSGHVLVNLINSWADQWINELDGEFDTYLHQVRREIDLAEVAVAELERLYVAEARRLVELSTARHNAFEELNPHAADPRRGPEPESPDWQPPDETGAAPALAEPRRSAPRCRVPSLVTGRPLGIFAHACRNLVTHLRGFMAMYDPAGMAYACLTWDDLAEAASDCVSFTFPSVIRAKGLDLASLDDPSAEANVIREANAQILDEVRRLVCARRVSRQWIRRFLEQALNPSIDDTTMQHVESEFPQLVANIVLDCPAPPAGRRPPHTTATLLDGVRIALLCALQRVHTYVLNSAVRQGTFGSPGEPSLIESYVRRSERASNVKSDILAAARARPAEGVTGLTSRRPAGTTTITLTASGDLPLTLENFQPVTISSLRDRRWIGYLSHHNTAAHLGGLPFDRWWSYWIRGSGSRGLLEATGGGACLPSVGVAGCLDEAADGDERGGEVKVEVDDRGVAVGAAAEFAVVVHPGVGAFDHPTLPDLNRAGYAFLRDFADHVVVGEDVAAGFAVVAGVQVHHWFVRECPDLLFHVLDSGVE
jgi:hypothetical protein